MLPVDVTLRIGFDDATDVALGQMTLTPQSIGNCSSYAGASHILVMGRHFDDYMMPSGGLMQLPTIPNFPVVHPFQRLVGKNRSNDVVGNIGESVAAIVGTGLFHLSTQSIAHLAVKHMTKTPDYLFRLAGHAPAAIAPHLPTVKAPLPEWWPVESKAAETSRQRDGYITRAFRQLISYWREVAIFGASDNVGFGMIASLKYGNSAAENANILVSVFLPRRHGALVTYLASVSTRGLKSLMKRCRKNKRFLRHFHGC